jgi:acid phosphatase
MKRTSKGTVLLACLACFALGSLSGGVALRGHPTDAGPSPKVASPTALIAEAIKADKEEHYADAVALYRRYLEAAQHAFPADEQRIQQVRRRIAFLEIGVASALRKAPAPVLPMETRLAANVYLQTSGEYHACCLQIYRLAAQRLEGVVRVIPFDRPAVVMDLDETVLDNSAFQTFLYQNKLEFSEALWTEFEEKHPREVTLIPGAAQFIRKAISLKVKVVFISNRSEAFRKSTELILAGELGQQWGADLILRAKDGSRDKAARREAVAAKYNIVMVLGDSLRDFSEAFKANSPGANAGTEAYLKAIQQRREQVDEAKCHWGIDWFVLPNPVYGEWEKLIGPDAKAVLHPTEMKVP